MAQFKVKGIISYPHLFNARAIQPGDEPKYSVSVLLKKGDPQIATIQALIEQEKANGWPSGFPANGKVFLKDGAVAHPDNPAVHEYMIVSGNARQDSKPAVVDMNTQPVVDPSQVYAGAICWVAFNSFTYNQAVNKGVSCGLNAVMITGEEGELGRLDGRPTVESMFADVTGTPAPATTEASTAAPIPAPNAPDAPAPTPQYVMTEKAGGLTRDQLLASGKGWTDELLIAQGLMLPPAGVTTSF